MRLNGIADEQLWSEVVEADRLYLGRSGRFLRGASDRVGVLRTALGKPGERGAALRLLHTIPDYALRRALLPDLVRLASLTHSDTVSARELIVDLKNESGFARELEAAVPAVLAGADDEQHRRIAELLADVDQGMLERHLDACRRSDDPYIREIADDFDADDTPTE